MNHQEPPRKIEKEPLRISTGRNGVKGLFGGYVCSRSYAQTKEIVIKSEFLKHFGNGEQLKGVFLMEESSTVGVVKVFFDAMINRGEKEDADLHFAWHINTHIGCDESAGAGVKTEILCILAGQVTTLAAMAEGVSALNFLVLDMGFGIKVFLML
ncbi:hypothetical protein Tco_1362079 [Tanacetum coccineum]